MHNRAFYYLSSTNKQDEAALEVFEEGYDKIEQFSIFSDPVTLLFSKFVGPLYFLTSLILLPYGIYKMAHAVAFSKQSKSARGMEFLQGASSFIFGLIGTFVTGSVLAIATTLVLITGSAKVLFDSGYAFSNLLYMRFSKTGRDRRNEENREIVNLKDALTPKKEKSTLYIETLDKIQKEQFKRLYTLENERIERNQLLADKSHLVLVSATILTLSCLMLTPLAPIMIFILSGVAAYGILHLAGLNPFTKIIKRAFPTAYPFKFFINKTQAQLCDELNLKHVPPSTTKTLQGKLAELKAKAGTDPQLKENLDKIDKIDKSLEEVAINPNLKSKIEEEKIKKEIENIDKQIIAEKAPIRLPRSPSS